jgi:glycerol-3-phosphate dehydrogenase
MSASHLAADQKIRLLEWYGGRALDLLALMRNDPALADHLAPGAGATAAEIVYACRAESAVSLADCMFLRTRLAVIDGEAADHALGTATALMARELGWDGAEARRQREAYEAQRDRERNWMAASTAG